MYNQDKKNDGLYLLDRHGKPVNTNAKKWTSFMRSMDRIIVAEDTIDGPQVVRVSTVFTGIDYRANNDPSSELAVRLLFELPANMALDSPPNAPLDKPLLWQTIIHGGEYDGHHRHYSSLDEAVAGHRLALTLAEKTMVE